MKQQCDIAEIEVPVLFYTGREEDLPDIFERINATGTKLSKYEIFAAAWVNQDINIGNEEVVEAIRKRYYALMTQKNISVNGVSADGTPDRLSLFDYLFGLGKVLSESFPLLFGGSDDPTAMESVAFAIATIAHKLPMSRMKELPAVMDRADDDRVAPDAFEAAMFEAARFVNATLSPFIGLKLNAESASASQAHTDLQIASMVTRALVGRYSPGTWETREEADDDWARLRSALPQYYLLDVLQQNWRGSGDTRLHSMTWDVEDDEKTGLRVHRPASHYLSSFGEGEFSRILDQWFSDQVRLTQRSRAYVTASAKAFLKYVYSDVVTVHQEHLQTFELDHVFPVSRLAVLAKASEDGWPISAVANLALFDWKTNREKSKLDLVQYINRVDDADRDTRRAQIEKYLFVPFETAAIPRQDDADILSRGAYGDFLHTRFAKMKSLLAATLGIAQS